jgi:hypothetical protein
MVGWGIFLIIIGAGSLLLPSLGYQFQLMELVDDFQPYAGIVVAIIGAGLVLMGMNRRAPATTTVESSQGSGAAAAPTAGPAEPTGPMEPGVAGTDAEDPYRRP